MALKILDGKLDSEADRARFDREARVTSQLEHPHIVDVYDHGVLPDGSPFIAFEYVRGADLASRLAAEEFLPPALLAQVGARVARALHAAHQAGVVHRDVKPENVLLRAPGDPVLVDFGVARLDAAGTVYTQDGMLLGTPSYMAPELWRGHPPSPASDQFAWAASLLELAGCQGFYGTREVGEILRVLDRGMGEETRSATRRLPPDLRSALMRALDVDPGRRFPDAGAFAAALERVRPEADPAHDQRVQATLVLSQERAGAGTVALPSAPGPRRRPGATAALVLLASLAAGAMWMRGSEAPPPAPAADEAGVEREAREALRQEATRLAKYLGVPTLPRHVFNQRERLVVLYPALVDTIFEMKWKRIMDHLGGVLMTASEGGAAGPTTRPLPELDLLTQLLYDVEAFSFRISYHGLQVLRNITDLRDPPGSLDWDRSWRMERLNDLRQFLVEDLEHRFRFFEKEGLLERPAGLEVQARLAAPFGLPQGLLALPEVHRRVLEHEEPGQVMRWVRIEADILERCHDRRLLKYRPRTELLLETRDRVLFPELKLPAQDRVEAVLLVTRELYRTPYFFSPDEPDELHEALKKSLLESIAALEPLVPDAPERVATEIAGFRTARHSNLAYPDGFLGEADAALERLRTAALAVVR